MASIRKRTSSTGEESHQATVRIKRAGKLIYQESKTFSRRALARSWGEDLEELLKQPGAIEARARGGALTVGALIRRYIDFVEPVQPLGRSKRAALEALERAPEAALPASELGSDHIIAYAKRRREAGAEPSTVAHDIIYWRMPFGMAKPAWKLPITAAAFDEAMPILKQLQLVGKSNKRDRRPTADELARLYALFRKQANHPSAILPMVDLCEYAIWTGKRESEVTRVEWVDYDDAGDLPTQLLRDMKHPRKKMGNDFRFPLLGGAPAIVARQPRIDARIFPFNPESVSARFTNACKTLGIIDLEFRDLRRECASRLFEEGYVPHEVAQVTGHRDLNILWQIYTKLDPARLEESRRRREARERKLGRRLQLVR